MTDWPIERELDIAALGEAFKNSDGTPQGYIRAYLDALDARKAQGEPTAEEARNELTRRQEAGHDPRVPLSGPPHLARYSDGYLRAIALPPL